MGPNEGSSSSSVLQFKFYYYSNTVGLTGQERTAIEKRICYSESSREGAGHTYCCGRGNIEETRVLGGKDWGEMRESLFCAFHGKEQEKVGKQA